MIIDDGRAGMRIDGQRRPGMRIDTIVSLSLSLSDRRAIVRTALWAPRMSGKK